MIFSVEKLVSDKNDARPWTVFFVKKAAVLPEDRAGAEKIHQPRLVDLVSSFGQEMDDITIQKTTHD